MLMSKSSDYLGQYAGERECSHYQSAVHATFSLPSSLVAYVTLIKRTTSKSIQNWGMSMCLASFVPTGHSCPVSHPENG